MYVVEVCYIPWHREVHGAKLSHQAIQLLPTGAALRGRGGKQMGQILDFLIREGYLAGFCVEFSPHNFLHTSPVSLP